MSIINHVIVKIVLCLGDAKLVIKEKLTLQF